MTKIAWSLLLQYLTSKPDFSQNRDLTFFRSDLYVAFSQKVLKSFTKPVTLISGIRAGCHRIYRTLVISLVTFFFADYAQSQTNTLPMSGNVGINTTNPTQALDVNGNMNINGSIYIPGPYNSFTMGLIGNGHNGSYVHMFGNNAGTSDQAGGTHFIINSEVNPSSAFMIWDYNSTGWSQKMVLRSNSGNLGLGTSNPLQRMHVVGNTTIDGALIIGDPEVAANNKNLTLQFDKQNEYASILSANWSGGYKSILFNKDATTDPFGVGIAIDGNPDSRLQIKGAGITASTSSFHAVNYGGVSLLYIRDDGNIGIGTTTPQARLAVNGDIFSTRVKVTQSGWPDYVFSPTYKLRPLSELQKFILLNQHLPDLPSAADVSRNGLDLGDNQAVLLKKIEELTLYIINQDKRIGELEKLVKPERANGR